jgi:hypothetical protein
MKTIARTAKGGMAHPAPSASTLKRVNNRHMIFVSSSLYNMFRRTNFALF